jgi:hypothetical protein
MDSFLSPESGVVLPFNVRFDQLSLSSCFIELHVGGEKFGHATGFFWRGSNTVYLVTNWHVVTGKNPFTKEFITQGRCPDSIRVYYLYYAGPRSESEKAFQQEELLLDLYEDYFSPYWLQHKQCIELGIDVVLIPVQKEGYDCSSIVCLND